MTIRIQQTIRICVFLTLFCLIFSYASAVVFPKMEDKHNNTSRLLTFYNQPEDSIDVLFLGASSFRGGIQPLTLWQDYGFTSYTLANGNQAPIVNYYYLVEALKYQHPKVVVIDGIALSSPYLWERNEPYLRIAVDPLNLSVDKFELITDIVSKSKNQTISSYLFPLFRYHSRWKEILKRDFEFNKIDNYDLLRGSSVDFQIVPFEFPPDYMKQTDEISKNDDISQYYYEKTIQLCKENNIEIVFVTLPRLSWDYSRYLGIKQFTDKYDLTYLDYDLPDNINAIQLDVSSDFYNSDHLNIYGALKISKHLGKYLQETYDLVDKRNNPDYEQWNVDLQKFLKSFTRSE